MSENIFQIRSDISRIPESEYPGDFIPVENYVSAVPEPQNIPQELISNDDYLEDTTFLGRYKRKIILGSAIGSMAILTATGAVGDTIAQLDEVDPAIGAAYGAGITAHVGGLAMMLTAAGQKINYKNLRNFKQEMTNFASKIRESNLMKLGFWTNTTGAVEAASVAAYGMIDTLPPTSWGLLAIPALDLYSTAIVRSRMYPYLRRRHEAQ